MWPFTLDQIKSLLLSHHHSTSALVSEILTSVLQTVQKNKTTIYIWTDSAKKQQTIYIWTDSAKKTTNNLHMDRQCKKLHWSIYSAPDSAKKQNTTVYIWTVHIYGLSRRQCAKYTYIYSVHTVYYNILSYQYTLYTVCTRLHYVHIYSNM